MNASDAVGAAAFDSILDFHRFDRPLRGYTKDGATGNGLPFPGPTFRGPCLTGQACRIWDYNLSTLDVYLRERLTWPTSDNNKLPLTVTHTFSSAVDDVGVCAEIPGAGWDDESDRCSITFLNQALELLGDGIGNDNGLCESNETCVFTPNFGAYQGHGSRRVLEANLSSGGLSGIRLEAYEDNGY
ncbi:MAG TPA: hypothetical protein VKZ49_15110 [Polyangiaceae bacterium]|nr:hypothetical protein [Polyangiaceae bacterium]